MDPKKSMYHNMQALKQNPETENMGKKWSEEETNNLLTAIKDGSSLDELAIEHKRSINSIRITSNIITIISLCIISVNSIAH